MDDVEKIIDESIDKAIDKYSERRTAERELTVEDVVFLHSIRKHFARAANIIGTAVILSVLGVIFFIVKLGLNAWKTQ